MKKIETPEEYLHKHPLTEKLRGLGVTDSQLESAGFRGNTDGGPFDSWAFRMPDPVPVQAISLIKTYCALKWLVLENPPQSRDTDDAWRLVASMIAAPIFETGLAHKLAQRHRAQKPRGKVADDGKSISEIIKILALNPEYESVKSEDLWIHFSAALDVAGLAPEEVRHEQDPRKSIYQYQTDKGEKKISFGTFANAVSKVRKEKGKLTS